MKLTASLVLACLALPAAAVAQVSLKVIEPTEGSNQVSPITVAATAESLQHPSGWAVYVDNALILHNSDASGRLDATFPASPGPHNVVVTAWDNSGANRSAGGTITVSPSPLPVPPSTATHFQDLQQQGAPANSGWDSWTACDKPDCSGTEPGSVGQSGFLFGPDSPYESLSGSAMAMWSLSNDRYVNTLGYRNLPCPTQGCTQWTNFLEDVWFYLPSANTPLQATEYDPGVVVHDRKFFASMQCNFQTGSWQYWDGVTWTPSGYECKPLEPEVWHHYQLYVTMDFAAQRVFYRSFVFDGSIVFQDNASNFAAPCFTPMPGDEDRCSEVDSTINIEQEIDNFDPTATVAVGNVVTGNTEVLDDYNLWAW